MTGSRQTQIDLLHKHLGKYPRHGNETNWCEGSASDSLYSHLFEHANDARLQTTILCLLKLEFATHQAQYGRDIQADSML